RQSAEPRASVESKLDERPETREASKEPRASLASKYEGMPATREPSEEASAEVESKLEGGPSVRGPAGAVLPVEAMIRRRPSSSPLSSSVPCCRPRRSR